MSSFHDWQRLLPEVQNLVLSAGDIILDHNRKPREIQYKGRIDLVTATDIAVEEYLKKRLEPLLPEATFLAEESAATASLTEYTWIIDPLDGTTNFAHGLPHAATSVGLWHKDRVVLGIINAPILKECYTAVIGGGAACNGEALRVSSTADLERSLVATGFPYTIERELPGVIARLQAVLPAVQGVRRCGSAALDLAYVAAGRYEAFYEMTLSPWDVAAGWLIVQEAGGMISRMDGSAYALHHHDILASNGRVHDAILALLEPFPIER